LQTNGSGTLSFANLAIANGGTGATSFTANQIHYGSFSQSAGLTFDGTNFATTGTATATKLIPTGTSVTGNGMYLPATNSVGISTNGTNAVYIDASQNVGIGTSSPQSSLQVAGAMASAPTGAGIHIGITSNFASIQLNGDTSTGSIIDFSTSGTDYLGRILYNNASNFLSFSTNSVERMRIASTGIVTMSAYGVGTATFSASGVISSVSDETWKIKDGIPVDPDSMLKKLEPGYWYYNDEKKEIFGVDRQLGFYAQNVNAAIGPEAAPVPETTVETTNDGTEISTTKPWGYYDRSVLAVVVMSLQKALATIETLTARIEALEAK
jgi:hypothetical protein